MTPTPQVVAPGSGPRYAVPMLSLGVEPKTSSIRPSSASGPPQSGRIHHPHSTSQPSAGADAPKRPNPQHPESTSGAGANHSSSNTGLHSSSSTSGVSSKAYTDKGNVMSGSGGALPAVRNTNLKEISSAVTSSNDDDFNKSTFALKRTQSMGVFEASLRPSTALDLIGNVEDYPHLKQPSSEVPSGSDTPNHIEDVVKVSPSEANSVEPLTSHIVPNSALALELESGSTSPSAPGTPELSAPPLDDSVIHYEPSRHVDYLSHNWKESDISSSWRYIVLRRKDMANSARLENASWRTWTKAKYNLKTVSPESVNWLKDYDVSWLYGPLYTEPHHSYSISPPDKSSTELLAPVDPPKEVKEAACQQKPILKKRSVTQMILSRPPLISHNSCNGTANCNCIKHHKSNSKSTGEGMSEGVSTYLRHHNYRHRPHYGHSNDNISSLINQQYNVPPKLLSEYPQSPSTSAAETSSLRSVGSSGTSSTVARLPLNVPQKPLERHIHFNDRVEQCIAVDSYSDDDDIEELTDNKRKSIQRPTFGLGDNDSSDEEDDEDNDGYNDYNDTYDNESDSEEEEAGLFLMVRSASAVSINNKFGKLGGLRSIALLPATTLKYEVDEAERESRQAQTANSVAYAMSHNTDRRRHAYSTYDYNSVYVSPKPSPNHSPSHSLSNINDDSSPGGSPGLSGKGSSVEPSTTTTMASGVFQKSDSSASVMLDRTSPRESDETPEAEFIEDTASPGLVSSPSESRMHQRINSAVSSAKGLASALWGNNWKPSSS